LIANKDVSQYSKNELVEAVNPVSSIINKCEKAQQKFDEENAFYTRYQNMIKAMHISKDLINDVIGKRA
jgi:hypothetical protein